MPSPWRGFGVFVLLALVLSWSYWLAVLAGQRGWIAIRVPLGPWGSFGPAAAGLLASGLLGGRSALRDLLRSLARWRVRWWLYAIALGGMSAVLAIALALQAVRGAALPAPFNFERWVALPGILLLIAVFGGPLGEEPGWRGYALHQLLRRLSPFAASLWVAAVWFVWHLPLFWLPGSAQADVPLGTFAWTLLCYALVFTWLYRRSGGSTLVCLVLHTGINTAWFVLPHVLPGAMEQPGFGASFILVSTLAAAAVLASGRDFFRRPSAETA